MSSYDFKDYKLFLKDLIRKFPKRGRGQVQKLADFLDVNPVVVSQILSSTRHFTPEQSLRVAEFFGLDERQTEYFLLLVTQARAGSRRLEMFYEKKLQLMRDETQDLKNRVAGRKVIEEVDQGRFYSNWYYSGIRLLSSIKGYHTVESIANYFGLSRTLTGETISFLVACGLCQEKEGWITIGEQRATHVGKENRFVNNHRRNWRLKAMNKLTESSEEDLFYSSPVSISKKDAKEFRRELVDLLAKFSKVVADSPAERLACLNVDWFEF